MSVNLLEDINFLRYYCTFLNTFLVVPWYDFKKNIICYPFLAKLYATCLILIRISLIVFTCTDQKLMQIWAQSLVMSQKFIMVFLISNLIIFSTYSIANSAFLDISRWINLFKNLRLVDKIFGKHEKNGHYLSKRFLCVFIMKHISFICITGHEIYTWSIFIDMPFYKIFLQTGYVDLVFEFFLIMFMAALLKSFEVRYKTLNKKLIHISNQKMNQVEVKKFMQIYRILGQNIQIFNELFGYPIVFMLFHFGVGAVSCLNFLFVYGIMTQPEMALFHNMIIGNICIILQILLNFLTILSSINATAREAKNFLQSCYRIREEFLHDSINLQALDKLIEHSKFFMQEFSTNGCFTLNKSIVFSLLANISTYLIITLQLNESQYQNVTAQNCSSIAKPI
ncbi:gustatory receptor 108 [Tribolium castaneum]|uniref:Gustatory receptor n=1 Tax=Tribolium castaneum TaxID=7070 RepID=D6WRP5_TRICA|nr:gustatory receptor 108 [Tribolium castaneum]